MAGPAMEKRGTRELIDSLRQTGGMLSGMMSELELEGGTENEKQALPSLDELDAMKTDEPEPDWGGMMAGLDEPQQAQTPSPSQALEYRAGLPTAQAVMGMAGVDGTKNSRFQRVFSALEAYQAAMDEPFEIKLPENLRETNKMEGEQVPMDQYYRCVRLLEEVIVAAEGAAAWSPGRFNRNSRAKKLIPPIAAMIPRAYATMEKLSTLQEELAGYALRADTLRFTLSQALTSASVVSDVSAYTGLADEPDREERAELSRDKMLKQMKRDTKKEFTEGRASRRAKEVRDAAQEGSRKAKLRLRLPIFGGHRTFQSPEFLNLPPEKQEAQLDSVTDRYVSRLRVLQSALDDVAETNTKDYNQMQTLGEKVHYHQLSMLLYEAAGEREAIKTVLRGGAVPEGAALQRLNALQGETLERAAVITNEMMNRDENVFKMEKAGGGALVPYKKGADKKGNYLATGGATSVAVLDFEHEKVLRSAALGEKGEIREGVGREVMGKILDAEADQKKAHNGIYDELAGKVSRFLGLNVVAQAKAQTWKSTDGQLVYGGSVMDMAKGKVGADYSVVLSGSAPMDNLSKRNKAKLELDKNGRLIEDILKMNAVDYLLLHGDRHSSNYLINLEAGEGESTVTGIDNDYIMGYSPSNDAGMERNINALRSVHNRSLMEYQNDLSFFHRIPADLRDAVQGADIEAYERLLEPYVPRATRYAAVQRMKDLKEATANAEIIDLTTPEGANRYLQSVLEEALPMAEKIGVFEYMGNTILRMFASSYLSCSWYDKRDLIQMATKLGMEEGKAKEILGE